jgi:DNA-directed RNA polymerase specialized sigma24 family protein
LVPSANAVSETLAEEIARMFLSRVWNKQHLPSRAGKVVNWIAGIARNRAIDVFRHQKSRRRVKSLF